MAIQIERRADLHDGTALHDRDPPAERHRLALIVRHVDHRRAQLAVEAFELRARLQSKLGVEVRERFVHQVDGRVADDGAGQRDALLLASRELRRAPREQVRKADTRRRLAHAAIDLAGVDAAGAQRKGDVVEDREMRIQRVVLEHHRHVAVRRLELIDAAIADPDLAGVQRLETREHAKQRRLAAARRPEKHETLSRLDVEA